MAKDKKSNLKEKIRWIFGHILAIVAIVIVILVFGWAYYFVIAPYLIPKPFIEKPSLPEDALERIKAGENIIKEGHLNYIINEIGAYKLGSPFGSKNLPVMEFVLTDTDETYYAYVKDHIPAAKQGNPKNEDIIIKTTQETAFNILKSDNTQQAVKEAKDKGKLQVELKADMKTLAAKGYPSIYETIK